MTLLDVFEAQAKRTPTATAVTVEDGKSYSYKELDLIALHLGTELACAISVAAVEVGQNETPLVAIMMTRGIALVAGILGILKAGAGTLFFLKISIMPRYADYFSCLTCLSCSQRTSPWTHHFLQTDNRTYFRIANASS
jgi:non-ribosomal peptide synthetase component F